ncbi:E3 ubiquitin-protein ligase RNF103-like [Glandiceps talaboti]
MFTKLLFVLLYFALLFLAVRLFELAAWHEVGFLAFQLVDPLSVSVKELKSILDQRGLSYDGVLEKRELSDLVTTSGDLTQGEVLTASKEEESSESTSFTCAAHFNEEVEDKKDSAWVIQVIPRGQYTYLPDASWVSLVKKISRFGVRTGIFHCNSDLRFCERKGWTRSSLILTLPQGRKPKDNVIMVTYDGVNKVQPVLKWISTQISLHVHTIHRPTELQTDWIETSKNKSSLQVILFSTQPRSPLFFSGLSVKFTGRFKFGKYHVDENIMEPLLKEIGVTKYPAYLIVTPEFMIHYGSKEGEFYNYRSMDLYLQTFYPEVNDVFLFSLLIVNLVCSLELFLNNSTSVVRRLIKVIWQTGKCNIITIILWMPLLWIVQLSYVEGVCKFSHRIVRAVSATEFIGWLRRDWILYGNHSGLIVVSFIVYGIALTLVKKQCGLSEPNAEESMNISEWWRQTMQQYYSLLFRTRFRSHGPIDVTLMEDGLDLLLERLAVPDFWLHPVIPTEYIKELPVWKYYVKPCDRRGTSKCYCGSADDKDKTLQSTAFDQKISETYDVCSDCSCHCPLCARDMKKNPKQKRNGRKYKNSTKQDYHGNSDTKYSNSDTDDQSLPMCTCSHRNQAGNDYPETLGCENSKEFDKDLQGDNRDSAVLFNPNDETSELDNFSDSATKSDKETSPDIDSKSLHWDNCLSCNCENTASLDDAEFYDESIPAGMIVASECAICLDNYEIGQVLCGLPCGHCYHHKCIVLWLESSNHCCPVCRWPAYKRGNRFHQHRD